MLFPRAKRVQKGGGGCRELRDGGTEGGKQSAEGDASDRGLAWGWRGTDRGVFLADRMQAFSRGGGSGKGELAREEEREWIVCILLYESCQRPLSHQF